MDFFGTADLAMFFENINIAIITIA